RGLGEGARGEREAVAQRVDGVRQHGGLVGGRVDLDLEADAELGRAVALQPECDERVARSANRELEPGEHLVRHRIAFGPRDGQEDSAPLSVPAPGGERLRDARVGAREVLVVEQRHDAIERTDLQRRVVACRVTWLPAVPGSRAPSSPGGRWGGGVSGPACRLPAAPTPLRYVARTFSWPVGSRAPWMPSPNCTSELPSSSMRVV